MRPVRFPVLGPLPGDCGNGIQQAGADPRWGHLRASPGTKANRDGVDAGRRALAGARVRKQTKAEDGRNHEEHAGRAEAGQREQAWPASLSMLLPLAG
jgi:hypothetical protein